MALLHGRLGEVVGLNRGNSYLVVGFAFEAVETGLAVLLGDGGDLGPVVALEHGLQSAGRTGVSEVLMMIVEAGLLEGIWNYDLYAGLSGMVRCRTVGCGHLEFLGDYAA
jgi:hypothetical protein